MSLSNHLQVPGTGTSGANGTATPHTPRGQRTTKSMTPTFLFGLSFLPSFHFQSPINSTSPHKFFHSWKRKQEAFPALLTPPNSSRVGTGGSTRFLDSLKKDDDDLWSSLGDSNLTSLSSIYEEGKEFLTPKRLHKPVDHSSQETNPDEDSQQGKQDPTDSKLQEQEVTPENHPDSVEPDTSSASGALESAPNLIPIKPKMDLDAKSKLDLSISKSIKRRKLSSASVLDSPNNSIASQIDSTIDSPVPKRKQNKPIHPPVSASTPASDMGEKVWYPELDDILIKCFLKYRNFRNNHAGYSSTSILKNTSQNKVLSRMLFNKTGILRTSKQISSRLFRLAKSKKLDKTTKSQKQSSTPSNNKSSINDNLDDIDELIKTPFEHLINSSSYTSTTGAGPHGLDSIKTNEIIDHELDLLLSSPKNNNGMNLAFKLSPKAFNIGYNKPSDPNLNHIFTKMASVYESSLSGSNSLNKQELISPSMIEKLKSENIPVWLLNHNLHMNVSSSTLASTTPISPFNTKIDRSLDYINGHLESFLKFDAKILNKSEDQEHPSMLDWKCLIKIYDETNHNSLFVEHVDLVNGYYSFDNDSYEVQVPFMKQFFAGYFNYLLNGTSYAGKKLSIVQIIYDNYSQDFEGGNKFDEQKSQIFGYFIHDFDFDIGSGQTSVNVVNLVNNSEHETFENAQNRVEDDKEDDNETVLADSSPYKISPNQTRMSHDSPLKPSSQLRIDTNKANANDFNVLRGPLTAPIYNADIVQKFNQNMLKQQESLRGQYEQSPNEENRASLQPPMNHSHSTGNIHQFRTLNISPPSSSPATDSPVIRAKSIPNQNYPNMVSSTPLRDNIVPNGSMNYGQPTPFIPPAQQQLMVNLGNGFIPFNSLHPKLQEQYMLVQRQFEMQKQEQQKMFTHQFDPNANILPQTFNDQGFMTNTMNAQFMPNQQFAPAIMPFAPAPSIEAQVAPTASFKDNKENIKPKEIKFGPILEYDPSKDSRKIPQPKVSKQNAGIHRFPINTPVSMYNPKKK
ncbi:uncharacterized protein CANTADRAFT_21565 [Suhomyces tanzawaensis NRRL Y-17324]|uniref:TEA domain-containing protein n=1 Tax=Suhomyces tanzawaensis NRRL Y-17324 TaxID=984487 RepID=A0A1E4SLD8_9ASCO|nr:uncharacterized protein CANTADRAFT_21565 [Suhomyces tanzawaensis NRRL Y-17324]ODV80331.1 hypothetical protein CANTADRAFT_21565 [Suhomyces tanzawaensis NRRL Y-17324]